MSQTPSFSQSQRTTRSSGRSSLSVESEALKVKVLDTTAVEGVTKKDALGSVPLGRTVVVVVVGILVVVVVVVGAAGAG